MAGKTLAGAEAQRVEQRHGAPAAAEPEPAALSIMRQYWKQLSGMLPSHVKPESWYAGAFAALYRNPQLMNTANRNPESLMFALMECARYGLEPGTKSYYLTPRPNRSAPGGMEVLGIVGYQGEIELMYRAGAVSSVIVEVVRENDEFAYTPGRDEIPHHVIDWRKSRAERGPLLLAYSYARMSGGGYSRPVIVTRDDIERAKKASPTAKSDHSPWKTDEEAMWLKTAAHRLAKWVPTSAEYVNTQREVLVAAAAARETAKALPAPVQQLPAPDPDGGAGAPLSGGGDAAAEAPTGGFVPSGFAPAIEDDAEPMGELDLTSVPDDDEEPAVAFEPAGQAQHKRILALLGKRLTGGDEHRHAVFAAILARPIASQAEVSAAEADRVYETLRGWGRAGELDRRVAGLVPVAAEPGPEPEGGLPDPDTDPRGWHADGHPRRQPNGVVDRVPVLVGDCEWCEPDPRDEDGQ